MNQLEILRESLGQCDEIILDALLMRNRIVEDIMAYKEANDLPILQPEQEARQKEWLEKRKHRSDNTSGLRGVSRMKNGHYRVSIGFKGQRYHLGTYASFQDAAAARLEAEEQIHGGFVAAYRRWQERAKEDPDWAQRTPFSFEIKKEGGQFQITTNAGQAQQRDGRDSR